MSTSSITPSDVTHVAPEVLTTRPRRRHKASILVIDPEPASRELLFAILTADGYAVHHRELDLESQLRLVKNTLPDLALVDVRKAGMDGYELCARLKNDPTTRPIPVIFISSIDQSINQAKALLSGAADYVTDPFDAQEVLWRIETHISLRRLRESLESAAWNHGAQPMSPNEDLERAFREIHTLTRVTGRKHAEERVRQTARELKNAEQALRASERNLRLITNIIPTFIHVLRADGSVLYVNQAVLDYTGLTLDDARKEDYRARVFHPEDVERLREERQEAFTRPFPFQNEQRVLGKDGRYRWFLIRYNPLLDEQGGVDRWYVAAIDIEDRKQAEDVLARQAAVRADVSAAFTRPTHLREILRGCTEAIVRDLDAAFARIWTLNTDENMLVLQASSGMYTRLDGSYSRIPVGELKVGLIAREKKAHFTNDVMHDPRVSDKRWARDNGMVAFAGYPLVVEDRLIGVVALFARRQLSESILDTLASTADTIAQGIERKRAEEALRHALDEIQKSESNLRRVIDTIPALAWCNLPDGPNEFLSKGWHEYTGLSPEQSHGWGWQAAFHPEDLPPLMERWLAMLASGQPDEIEARLRRHDGVYRWFLIRAEPFRDESGRIIRWYGTSTDIDDRKRAEALLAEEKRLLEMVAAGRPLPDVLDALCRCVEDSTGQGYCGIYLIDPTGARFQNAAAPHLPSSFNDPIEGSPVDHETGPCGEAACRKTQVIVSDVASDPRWPGSFRPLALAHGLQACWSTPILSLAGEVLGTFAIYRKDPGSPTPLEQDLISRFTHIASIAIERAHAEAALRRSEAFLAEAQRLSLTGSFSWRVATDEVTWSEQLYRIYEVEIGVPVTLDLIRTRVHPEDVSLLEKMKSAHSAGGENSEFEWQYRLLMPDGSIKYLHAVAHATRDRRGQLEYTAAVQDMTARKGAEEALNRARSELSHMARVTTLSALTASIAHEINQPISAAVTSAGACQRWLDGDRPDVRRARAAARRIEDDGRRAAAIITHLKSLYRKDVSPRREPVSVNHLVGEMLLLLRSEADRHSVAMRTELAKDLPRVSADRVQLQQVLMNLMLNGMEAMSDQAGVLTITTRRQEGAVLVSVSDTGVGVPVDRLDDIFNAFVTTKPGGTGMGLAISRTIVDSHGGRLWATANAAGGATFHFTLPSHPAPP